MAALCLHFSVKCKTALLQASVEMSLALDTNEADLLPWMKQAGEAGGVAHAACLQKGHPVLYPWLRRGTLHTYLKSPCLSDLHTEQM